MSEPTAVPAAEATPDFAAFEAEENRRALGEPEPEPAAPVTPAADPDADEQDAAEAVAEPVPAVEAKPEPTPEKPVSKRQQHINDLERKAKLAEIRAEELATKIAALEAKTAPAAEPKPKSTVVADATDPKPIETDFEAYADFIDARSRWNYRQAKREDDAKAIETKAAEQETTRKHEFDTKVSTWIERRDAFLAKHPDRADRVSAFLDTVRAGTPIGDALLESEVGGELADYLASNPTEAERIARLAPISALRALGKLETLFSPLTSASASAGPAAKTVTTAPAPPTTLAARSASPADPVRAAVANGDYSAFEAEENRKAIAASR